MQETLTTDPLEIATEPPVAGTPTTAAQREMPTDGARTVERKTLSVRRVIKVGEGGTTSRAATSAASGAGDADTRITAGSSASSSATAGASGAVPLKRLTAGRKELSILHDGSTYLLRVTKANKLILTKA